MGKEVRNPHQKMTVYDHIRELQMRFLYSGMALTLAGALVFLYYQPLLIFLSSPLGAPLYYNNPAGGFNFIVKVCFTGALILTMPVLIYNIIMFVRPAIEKHLPIKKVFLVSVISTILAIAGAAFAFYCILPGTLHFLKEFENSGLSALITADDYLKFVTNIIITFVVVFQLPLIITFFDTIKPLQTQKLLKMEKWVIAGSIAVSLITPIAYDPVTGLLLAVPITVLYNLSIVIVIARHAIAKRQPMNSTGLENTYVQSLSKASFIIDDRTIADFLEELKKIDKAKPQPITPIRPANAHTRMDIGLRRPAAAQPVQPPAWIKQKQMQRHIALNQRVRVFSDIRPAPRINRILAS